ncbi:uncharacterized protein LOC121853794 [Homarus americanus]|uniref:Uncharacterized protein n=1 Tax=Homarus americanus TaxID=6706 RepID=A0A8J5JGF6_HOMAM|nr:uncharacterized protein LOC121853794 [Homarus americanus]KAG7156269.1 hypothetical protein Hamer_G005989 [Homarus americanus]
MPSTVVTSTLPAATAVMHQVDESLRTLGFDLKSLVKAFDLQTVGLLTLVVVVGIFLFDLLNYGYSSYQDDSSTYTSYGRSLVTTAARVWDHREQLGLNPYVRGGRGLDSMTQILDSLADAVLKYEDLETNDVPQARQSKDL